MKVSEMNNDQASEVLIRVSTPFANILDDENARPLIDEMSKLGEKTKLAHFLPKFVAFALKDHKDDLYEIVGALTFKPTSKVGKMNFIETVKELKDSLDEELLDFFKSSGSATATPGNE